MTGQAMIAAVAGRLGMPMAPSASTNPSRTQILEWINAAKVEVARGFQEELWELRCEHYYFPLDSGTHEVTNFLAMQFVTQVGTGEIVRLHEEVSAQEAAMHKVGVGSKTKHIWWFAADGQTTRSGTEVRIGVFPLYSGAGTIGNREYHYTRMPDNWVDAAITPSVCMPARLIPYVIARASVYGLMADGRDELAVAILGGQR